MEYQIIDKEYGPQIIPVINSMTIEANTPEEAVLKALNYFGFPIPINDEKRYQELLLAANIEAKPVKQTQSGREENK